MPSDKVFVTNRQGFLLIEDIESKNLKLFLSLDQLFQQLSHNLVLTFLIPYFYYKSCYTCISEYWQSIRILWVSSHVLVFAEMQDTEWNDILKEKGILTVTEEDVVELVDAVIEARQAEEQDLDLDELEDLEDDAAIT